MSTDQYPCTFSRQIEAFVYISHICSWNNCYPILLKVTSWQCNQAHRWKRFSWSQKSSVFVSPPFSLLGNVFLLSKIQIISAKHQIHIAPYVRSDWLHTSQHFFIYFFYLMALNKEQKNKILYNSHPGAKFTSL